MGHDKKTELLLPLKRYISHGLSHDPVKEAYRMAEPHTPPELPAGSDRQQVLPDERPDIRRVFMWQGAQEAVADADGQSEVYLVYILFLFSIPPALFCHLPSCVRDYGLAEIVKGEPRPYLLYDRLGLAAVVVGHSYGIFQFPEGGLHAPAHPIEAQEFRRRERVRGEVCHKQLIGAVRQHEADESQRHGVCFIGAILKKVERDLLLDEPCAGEAFEIVGLPADQGDVDSPVKPAGSWEVEPGGDAVAGGVLCPDEEVRPFLHDMGEYIV